MDWKAEAIAELKQYNERRRALKEGIEPNGTRTLATLINITNRGLECIGERLSAILEETYINGANQEELCRKFNIDIIELRQTQNMALYYFTIAHYGLIDY